MKAAGLARRLGATRQGHDWRCACPLDCGYALSLTDGANGQLLAFCFGGHSYDDLLPVLVEVGLLDDDGDGADQDDGGTHRVDQRRRCDDTKRIARAQQIYDSGAWDERIRIYLRSRGIDLGSPVLRFRLGIRYCLRAHKLCSISTSAPLLDADRPAATHFQPLIGKDLAVLKECSSFSSSLSHCHGLVITTRLRSSYRLSSCPATGSGTSVYS